MLIKHNLTVIFLDELQNKLHNVMESSRGAKEECLLYKNKLSSLQVDVESLTRENDQLKVQIDQAKTDLMLREQTYNKYVAFNNNLPTM